MLGVAAESHTNALSVIETAGEKVAVVVGLKTRVLYAAR